MGGNISAVFVLGKSLLQATRKQKETAQYDHPSIGIQVDKDLI
jgi:hypothetical protein